MNASESEPPARLLVLLGVVNFVFLCTTVGVDLWILDVRERIVYGVFLLAVGCVIGTIRRVRARPRLLGWPKGTQLVILGLFAFVVLMLVSVPNGHSVTYTVLVGGLLSIACAAAFGLVGGILKPTSAT